MKLADIPSKFSVPFASSAGGGYITAPVPEASQIGIANGRSSLPDGFPPLTFLPVGAGGYPPFGQDMNGVLFQSTGWGRWFSAGGPVKWDSSFSTKWGGYPKDAVVMSATVSGRYWRSTVDDNTTNPDTGGANWETSPLITSLIHYGTDTGTVNALTITDLNPPISAYALGLIVATKPANANTGFTTLTVSDAAGTPLAAKNIVRADGTGGKLVGNDIKSGAMSLFMYDGTSFQALAASGIAVLNASATLYVNGAIGSDANDGTANNAQHALATIQAAINKAFSYGPSSYVITIEVAAGTYAPFYTPSQPGPSIIVNGVGATTIIDNTATSLHCVTVFGPNTVQCQNLKVTAAGAGLGGFVASGNSAIVRTLSTSSSAIAGAIWEAFGGGQVLVSGNHTISGSAVSAFNCQFGGIMSVASVTITISTPVTITNFADCTSLGLLTMNGVSVPTFTNPGNVTGTRYRATTNGVINTQASGANFFPGTLAGSTATGGQYV